MRRLHWKRWPRRPGGSWEKRRAGRRPWRPCWAARGWKLSAPRCLAPLDAGVSAVAVKEIVYQAVDYLGLGRVLPFLTAANDVLLARGVELPLPGQATTTAEDRLEKGAAAQAEIFGEHMKEAGKTSTINCWLAANCFGDYYTRHRPRSEAA